MDKPLLLPPASVGGHNPTRVEEGKTFSIILTTKMKTRTVVGRGTKDPLCDRGSELLLGESAREVRRE